jgi:hypothetical protein
MENADTTVTVARQIGSGKTEVCRKPHFIRARPRGQISFFGDLGCLRFRALWWAASSSPPWSPALAHRRTTYRRYRTREGHLPLFGFTISRADAADFMIKSAEGHLASRKIIGVYN